MKEINIGLAIGSILAVVLILAAVLIVSGRSVLMHIL
jgi:hypothetical protein